MSIQSLEGASQSYFDDMLQSEITIMTSAIPADTSGGGIRMNSVLKDGGNIFSGAAFLGFSSGDVAERQRRRRAARRAAQHQQPPTAIKHIHMFTGSLGGPDQARQDVVHRLRRGISRRTRSVADVPVQITTPQGEVINSYLDTYVRGPSLRVTWQAAQKHKLASLRSAVVEAEGHALRRRAGPATRRSSAIRSKAHHTVGNIR